ncbi:DUF2790 domain-containing protein [Ectopseudomonas mendocina]|uniref:DUF2790 domain-containing protein n=1 Tax=Ectopseudomonas mendocina TaxID=300 RepID=A0ABZ2REW5_ECTME
MRIFALALSLLAFSSWVQANDSQADTYRYGNKLDIARVLSIKHPQDSQICQPGTAVMTYEDSKGQVRKLSYQTFSENCLIQN